MRLPPALARSTTARRLWHVLPKRVRHDLWTRTERAVADLHWVWGLRGLRPAILLFHLRARRRAWRAGDAWITAATPPYALQVLLRLARGRKRIVELGTGAAWTTLTLALDDADRRITTYDPEHWDRERYTRLVPRRVSARIEFVPTAGSAGPLEHPGLEPVELLYIDSSHERDQTIEEFTAWRSLLAPDAIVVFDDLHHPRYPGVTEAIRDLGLTGEEEARFFVYRHSTT